MRDILYDTHEIFYVKNTEIRLRQFIRNEIALHTMDTCVAEHF
jgi:hypothetical protein